VARGSAIESHIRMDAGSATMPINFTKLFSYANERGKKSARMKQFMRTGTCTHLVKDDLSNDKGNIAINR